MSTSNTTEAALHLLAGGGGTPAEPQRKCQLFADLPDVLTTAEAAAALRTNTKTLRGLIDTGQLYAVRLGRVFRIPRTALLDFIEGRPPRGRGE